MGRSSDRVVYRREDGKWVHKLSNSGRVISTHNSKSEALREARKALATHGGDLVVHSKDGRVESLDSHVNASAKKRITASPKPPIRIVCSRQLDGIVCSLSQASRRRLQQRVTKSVLPSSVAITDSTRNAYQQMHGNVWYQIAGILAGLSDAEIQVQGGFVIRDAQTGEIIYDSSSKE